jgi:hypothetical protein
MALVKAIVVVSSNVGAYRRMSIILVLEVIAAMSCSIHNVWSSMVVFYMLSISMHAWVVVMLCESILHL